MVSWSLFPLKWLFRHTYTCTHITSIVCNSLGKPAKHAKNSITQPQLSYPMKVLEMKSA